MNDEGTHAFSTTNQHEESVDPHIFENDVVVDDTETNECKTKTEEELMECKYCPFKAPNWPAFAKHVFRPYHIKKMMEVFDIKPNPGVYWCDTCSINCSGSRSFREHLLGSKHRKRSSEEERTAGGGKQRNNQAGSVKSKKPYYRPPQKSAKEKAIGAQVFANYQQPLIGLEYVTEVQMAGQNPRYECSLCDAKFDNDLKFPHLVGQKHRMNVLKIKRPGFVKELHPTNKKRSELTAALLKEAINLELTEGRKEVKVRGEKKSPGHQSSRALRGNSGGATGIQARTENSAHSSGGSWSDRELPFSNSGGSNVVSFSPPSLAQPLAPPLAPLPSYDSCGRYGNDGYDTLRNDSFRNDSFSYDIPHNASFDNPDYGIGFQQSSELAQGYPDCNPPFFGGEFSGVSPQIEPPPQTGSIPSGLASALGDLTKLVQSDEDAAIALQVSSALTKALLQYRMNDFR